MTNVFFSYSQELEKIVDTSKQWNVLFGAYYSNGGSNYYTEIYTIGTDTLINDITYSKVWTANQYGSSNYSFIREDLSGKVFYLNYLEEEYLIYDFNLILDDEIILIDMSGQENLYTVENVDTIFFSGKDRKRITLFNQNFGEYDYWIEGIGSLLGLPFSGNLVIDASTELLCFYQDEELLYSNPQWNSCDINLLIDDNYSKSKIYPNPTNGKINIETQGQIEKITILDISGKIILETTNTKIDLTKQQAGTYFVKIETKNGILTEKIIIE